MVTRNRFCRLIGLGIVAVSGATALAAPATLPATRPATAPAGLPATKPIAVKPGSEPLLTMDEFKGLYEQGKYPELLKQLPRVLILRGKAAEPYNKYDLLMLRFETHMHMKSTQPAISTLNEAQGITDDPKKVNYCKAVAILIKRSKNLAYQPGANKKDKPQAIDIIEPESRQKALKALLADEMAVVSPKVTKAIDGQSLAGIAEAVGAIQGLDVLESAAGAGEESTRMIADLRDRGNAIMAKTVIRLTARVDEIYKDANTLQRTITRLPNGTGGYIDQVRLVKRGLSNTDYKELNDAIKSCDQIIPNVKGLAAATGGKQKEIEDLIAGAEEVRRKADKALKTNYSE